VADIDRQRTSPRFGSTLLASLLAALLLSACGGNDAETTATAPSPSGDQAKPHDQAAGNPAGRSPRGEPQISPEQAKKPAVAPPTTQEEEQPSADHASHSVRGCPPGLSDRGCREVASANTRQERTPPQTTEAERCPDSLSRAECQALVSAPNTGAPEPGSPTECPPALSATQCAELEERYAAATK
jgi:hypothetical protein